MATTNATSNMAQTSAYSYLQYKNKISGLVSGMDIDSLMEKLMKAESGQMEKLQQQKQKYEWKRDAYREVNTKLSTFEQNAFTDYGLKSAWNTKTVKTSSSSITATATSSANGTLNITEAKLATSAQAVVDMGDITADTTMSSIGVGDGSFSINAVDENGNLVSKTISYSSTDKVSDVMSKINSSGVGITAIVSDKQLSLTANFEGTAKENGIDTGISMGITEDNNNLFVKLKILKDISTNGTIQGDIIGNSTSSDAKKGENGHIIVNGVKINGTSNVYNVSGYKININKEIKLSSQTTDPADSSKTIIVPGDEPVRISSTTDTDKIIDKVKAFVSSYNDLIASLNTSVSQKKNVDYAPLTDAQKAEMTTDQITKWEEKAKAGLLKGDTTLNNVISSMRTTLSTYGFGSSDTLAKIGITTSKTYTDNGKLEIDEDKLKEALANDPDAVSRIFTGDSATGSEGIVAKLRTTVQAAVKTIKNTAGSESSSSDVTYALGKTITSLNTKIDDWKDRLKNIEERYWNQFSAMEKAIQKANSQTSIFDSY